MDTVLAARELVRALRGRRSQTALARRLGYRTNVVYSWEAGRDFPTAAKLFNLATRTGVDVHASLERFHRGRPAWLPPDGSLDAGHVAELLRDLQGGTSVVDLAHATGYSRFQVARWLSGATEPKLPAFLDLIEATSLRLLDFVAALVDPELVPSLAPAYRDLVATRRAAHDLPWTQAVLRCLELADYQRLPAHRDGWIAARLGLTRQDEAHCLALLEGSGQIRMQDGRWQVTRVLAVDTRRDRESTQALREFWADTALQRLRAGDAQVASYNVFGVSRADLLRLRELYAAYFRQMRTIIAQSEPVEEVVLANFQLVALGGGAPGEGARASEPPAAAARAEDAMESRKTTRGRGKRRAR